MTTDETMSVVDELSQTYDSDPGHNQQVTVIALSFFDYLAPLHHLGSVERRLLEIASRLHDIGWSRTVLKRHHKLSGKMILEADIPGLDSREKTLSALIARYHTKALPDASKNPKFAALKNKDREIVEWLAAILRVADALDSSHTSVIKQVKLKASESAVHVFLESRGDCWDEMRRVRNKQDLLLKKVRRDIVYQC